MTIIIAGDFVPKDRLAYPVNNKEFFSVFPNNLVEIINSADYSVVNFESPLADDEELCEAFV